MSERSGGFGAFLFGIVLGAVAGFVFAPTESGESARRKVTKGLRNLKELAEEKVDDVRGLLKEAEDEAEESDEDDDEEPEIATREQLRRRLDGAHRRRGPAAPRRRAPVPVVLDSYVRGTACGPERSLRYRGEPILAEGQAARHRHGVRRRDAVPRDRVCDHDPRGRIAARVPRVQHGPLLRHLQIPAQPAHLLAYQCGGLGVLRGRVRDRQTAVRAVRDTLRNVRPRGVGRESRRALSVPAVDLLHGLCVSARRRSGGNVRPDAHAAPATRAPGMNSPVIDLRSDTVTKPSPAMRRAIADAEVGDDVLDGDPTTRRLEARVAELLGTEDALFFPSGTQANQTGIALVTEPGTELLLEANAHLVHSEMACVAALSRVQIRPITTPDGLLTADLVRGALRSPSPHVPRITALAIENTHSNAGGRVLDAPGADRLTRADRDARLAVHLDGARLWNAAAAAGVAPARLAQGANTVKVSISKGLCCPLG